MGLAGLATGAGCAFPPCRQWRGSQLNPLQLRGQPRLGPRSLLSFGLGRRTSKGVRLRSAWGMVNDGVGLVGLVYISVSAVMAAMGSALTAGHFGKEPQSNQRALAPTLGTSLTLGVPVIRQGFGGPPPRAIHGAGRLNRHPCRFTPQIPVEFRPACLTGRLGSRSRSKAKAQRPDSRLEWCRAKAVRCRSGTHFSHHRNKGYVHTPIDSPPTPMLSYTSCFGCPSQGETGNRCVIAI